MRLLRGSRTWRPIELNNSWVVEYPADDGVLRVAPARLQAEYRIGIVEEMPREALCILVCQVRLADSDGRLWQCDSLFSPNVFMRNWLDLSRKDLSCWERNAPDEWKKALKARPLLSDFADTFDHRTRRWFYLGGMACYLWFKYLAAGYDLFALGKDRLLVRVKDPFGSTNWLQLEDERGEPVAPPPGPVPFDEDEDEEEGICDYDHYPPAVYPLDVRRLLFHHARPTPGEDKDEDEDESWWEGDVVPPLRFTRTRGKGSPQPAVTHRRPDPPAPPRPAGDGEFVPLKLENLNRTRLRTSAAGELELSPQVTITFSACFEIAPGSEREPIDVVRCRVRLVDEAGGVWEATNHFTPEVFVEAWNDLMGRDNPAFEDVFPWEQFGRKQTLCQNVRGTLEGGWRHLLVDEAAASIYFDRQQPRFSLIWADNHRPLWVIVRGLTGFRRQVQVDHDSQVVVWVEGNPSVVTEAPLRGVVFGVEPKRLLFRNTTFAVDDGFWHHNDLPIPVVFDRLELRAEPQEGVAFVPSEERKKK